MERPLGFRPATWDFIEQASGPIDSDQLDLPGALAVRAGVMEYPHLLANTVIELDNDCEYVIRLSAATQVAESHEMVELERLYDKQPHELSRAEFLLALERTPTFDQLDQ